MSSGFFLTEKQVKCENCGGLIQIPLTTDSTVITCEFCRSVYEYNPEVHLVPKLRFEDEEKQTFEYALATGVLIGREGSSNFITIQSDLNPSLKQNICIRNPYVSRCPHLRIKMQDEISISSCGESKRVINKKKCTVEDCKSTNGTAVNDHMLKLGEPWMLKHGDRIVLAPNSQLPLAIGFEETVQNP
ncbi:MAG: FHA domain-containing protein [Candidatus Bathyarchaeota archaeon]|nr:FHA domain-containing protein [Candidatus Bathyarchaeota archaeon]